MVCRLNICIPTFMNLISPQAKHPNYHQDGVDAAERLRLIASKRTEAAPPEAYSYNHPILSVTIKVANAFAICITTFGLAFFSKHFLNNLEVRAQETADLVSVLTALLWPKNKRLLNLPELLHLGRQVRYVGPAVTAAGFIQLVTLCLLNWRLPLALASSLVWWVAVICSLVMVRFIGNHVVTRGIVRRHLTRRIAVIGDGVHASRLAACFTRNTLHGFAALGVFSDSPDHRSKPEVSGSLGDLVRLGREHTLHCVIIAFSPSADHEQQVKEAMWKLRSVPTDIYILPYLVHGPDMALPVETLGPIPLMVLRRRPLTEWQVLSKLVLDLGLGAIILVMLLPLVIFVACAIKLDSPGPILFRQPRLGFNNRIFTVYKFRSMYAHMTDHTAARQTTRDDPRVTRVGKWLRKLSIDELPQLLNVFRNEMSLVGPRPHAPDTRAGGKLLDDALAEYVIRHQVKPGITGWAQVNGSRGELVTTRDLQRRVILDLEYMQRWSIWFDVKIMILTLFREVVSHNSF